MNWFSITMYARARKKGIITSLKPATNMKSAPPGDKKQISRLLHKNERTILLNAEALKETA